MKVELHLHTNRYSACALCSPRQVLWKLYEEGYDAAYITEHDAVWSDRDLDKLRADFPRMAVFPGVELTLGHLGALHLLVLGTNDPKYLRIRETAEVIRAARDEGHLTVLAHPYRWQPPDALLGSDALPDALEHRTPNHGSGAAELAAAAAARLNLPLVNSGDVHCLRFVGQFWVQTARELESADDIREIMMERGYENRSAAE
jgi:predicted metal-dependent phosphoesterase TrpH